MENRMKVFYEQDASFDALKGKVVGVVGYGNQGRAQALNLRDSGVTVIIGNLDDEYGARARGDQFETLPITEVAKTADVVMMLIPDEVQAEVYATSIEPHIRGGAVLCFASGYNIRFGLIRPRAGMDVIMVAPRTIGREVRESFERGSGVNADVDVWQDASGEAWPVTLALAKAIGCTRAGAFHTSFAVETELDLFSEQALWPALIDCLLTAYEVLVANGYPKEAIALELYASGEPADIFRAMARHGIFDQMMFHSPTAQYGVLSRRKNALGNDGELRRRMEISLEHIRSGEFAREWTAEQIAGYPNFNRLRGGLLQHPLQETDGAVRRLLKNQPKDNVHA
jgi:ketol-acid reductoisomerase